MPGLLGRDSYDNDAESDDDEEELEFYRQRSGREVAIGAHDGFRQTRRGRRVIPPDRLGANPAYRDIGFPGENMGAYQCGRKPSLKIRAGKLNQAYTQSLNWDRTLNMMRGGTLGAMWAELEQNTDQIEDTVEWMNPALFSVKVNMEDTPNWSEAMGGPNGEGYWQACKKEFETLILMKVWEEVQRKSWMNVIPGTWAFRCKSCEKSILRSRRLPN
jgi:hypothetical protein